MQRYQPRYNPKHFQSDLMQPCKSGLWVRAAEAQAEIDALHAECDRLTALLGKPKVLEAHEVTEPGFYWWRWRASRWVIVVARFDNERIVVKTVLGDEIFLGQFIGPLPAPEV